MAGQKRGPGRPPTNKPKNRQINVRLEEALIERLDRLIATANAEGNVAATRSDAMRFALNACMDYLEKDPKRVRENPPKLR